jgi:hypothetical protein
MLAEIRPFGLPAHPRIAAADRLREALLALAQGRATVLRHAEKSWASVTFAGARHRVELLFDGAEAVEAGELFIALLPEHEFDILGQLVADAAVTEVDHRLDSPRMTVRCELLLLDEG